MYNTCSKHLEDSDPLKKQIASKPPYATRKTVKNCANCCQCGFVKLMGLEKNEDGNGRGNPLTRNSQSRGALGQTIKRSVSHVKESTVANALSKTV